MMINVAKLWLDTKFVVASVPRSTKRADRKNITQNPLETNHASGLFTEELRSALTFYGEALALPLATSPSLADTAATDRPQTATYLPPTVAYDLWAEVYDTDSNFLQKLDDLQLSSMLPRFLGLCSEEGEPGQVRIVDLGCGTGRNTVKLLSVTKAWIVGLDASTKMLHVARLRCGDQMSSLIPKGRAEGFQLKLFDMLSGDDPPSCAENATGVVSTLVLEHIPAPSFFRSVAALLVPGGYLLITNMHPEMGAMSQAGFRDPQTGEKIRTLSYIQCRRHCTSGRSIRLRIG